MKNLVLAIIIITIGTRTIVGMYVGQMGALITPKTAIVKTVKTFGWPPHRLGARHTSAIDVISGATVRVIHTQIIDLITMAGGS